MNIPDSIKFLGHSYSIHQVSASELQGGNGEMWAKFSKIKIDKDLPESRKQSVLLHEIIEAIDTHFELNIDHKSIECLEECLYAIIVDNPCLFK